VELEYLFFNFFFFFFFFVDITELEWEQDREMRRLNLVRYAIDEEPSFKVNLGNFKVILIIKSNQRKKNI